MPLPLWLWVAGAAGAVALSFVVIGLVVEGARPARRYPTINVLKWKPGRLLVDPRLWRAGQALSVALLVLIVAAGVIGSQNPMRNLAPTAIWVVWWVGFAYVSALAGDIWKIINPWSALFDLVERGATNPGHRVGATPRATYPRWLGVWPAVVLFGGFAWIELVFTGRAIPAQLAVITILYSLTTWTGMAIFGRAVWLRRGDPFAVAFGVLARFAPTELRVTNRTLCQQCDAGCAGGQDDCVNCIECFVHASDAEREFNLRPFAAGLFSASGVSSSMTAFVLMLLATVTFDGFTATSAWATLENALFAALPWPGDIRLTAIATAGLVAFPLLFMAVYRAFAAWMAAAAGRHSPSRVGRLFVLSLVPIALAYHLAHYFTYLVIQGQLMIPLLSDPFGFGWNLLGTARFRPDIGIVGARFAWYTAVIAIVVGHIIAVYVAHMIALREFPDYRAVVKSQLVMLVLMVGYTTVSLWIIAQPIVETRAGG